MEKQGLGIDDMDAELILRKRKALLRNLLASEGLTPVKIAVVGSSTTQEYLDLLEVLLLADRLQPTYHQGDYNRFYEESVVDPRDLISFGPDVVILPTCASAIRSFPPLGATEEVFQQCIEAEAQRFRQVWDSIEQHTTALILQNNFEPPATQVLGGLEGVSPGGRLRFCRCLNEAFAQEALKRKRLVIMDQAGVYETLGRDRFLDPRRWFRYKILTTPEGSLELARVTAGIFRAIYGRSRKCLALDLDNTLWGGIIGDDGPERIQIGRETPQAEAYTAFQEYCLRLHDRGIILAVCSKNEESIARKGFEHPDSVLKLSHFAAFKANWEPKHENLIAIARKLNIGLDSLVFVDDNPAERHIVSAQLPSVAVPDMGTDVEEFIRIIERHRYFEVLSLVAEDLARAGQYGDNTKRTEAASRFKDYGEYLLSLEMRAEISGWKEVYLDRITQLCNKTNQFNLTTRRYTPAEIQAIHSDQSYITLYGKLSDTFGDNGLISLVFGCRQDARFTIETWLMSCRVLKRDMEMAMLDSLVARCQASGVREIFGDYYPTEKNGLVSDLYEKLGFTCLHRDEGGASSWRLSLEEPYEPRNRYIKEITHD